MLRTIFMVESSNDYKISVPDRKANTITTSKSRMLTPIKPIYAIIGLSTYVKKYKKTVYYYNQ